MFTLVHELAHVWIGESALINLPEMEPGKYAIEQFCNRVAAEFLVPEERMRRAWAKAEKLERPFRAIARRFKVSPIVVGRRAKDLGLISAPEFFDFYNAYMKEGVTAIPPLPKPRKSFGFGHFSRIKPEQKQQFKLHPSPQSQILQLLRSNNLRN